MKLRKFLVRYNKRGSDSVLEKIIMAPDETAANKIMAILGITPVSVEEIPTPLNTAQRSLHTEGPSTDLAPPAGAKNGPPAWAYVLGLFGIFILVYLFVGLGNHNHRSVDPSATQIVTDKGGITSVSENNAVALAGAAVSDSTKAADNHPYEGVYVEGVGLVGVRKDGGVSYFGQENAKGNPKTAWIDDYVTKEGEHRSAHWKSQISSPDKTPSISQDSVPQTEGLHEVNQPIADVFQPSETRFPKSIEGRGAEVDRAMDPRTPAEELSRMSLYASEEVKIALAQNPRTPAADLSRMSLYASEAVKIALAGGHNTPAEDLSRMSLYASDEVKIALAKNQRTPAADLSRMSLYASEAVKIALAGGPNTPAEDLSRMSLYASEEVKIALAQNPRTPISDLSRMSLYASEAVRAAIKRNPSYKER